LGKSLEYLELVLGWLLGIFSLVIAEIIRDYFAKRNLETQQEYNLKALKMQLYHEDRKRALIELDELLKTNYKTFDDFKKATIAFLDGKQALFLPRKLRSELRGEVLRLDGFLLNRLIKLGHYQEPRDEWLEDQEAEAAAWAEDFPEEALDAEVRQRLSGLKSSMRDKIKKYVSEE